MQIAALSMDESYRMKLTSSSTVLCNRPLRARDHCYFRMSFQRLRRLMRKPFAIADFGIGSDSPIILYDQGPDPCVMHLHWPDGVASVKHAWLRTHPSFAAFAQAVGLI